MLLGDRPTVAVLNGAVSGLRNFPSGDRPLGSTSFDYSHARSRQESHWRHSAEAADASHVAIASSTVMVVGACGLCNRRRRKLQRSLVFLSGKRGSLEDGDGDFPEGERMGRVVVVGGGLAGLGAALAAARAPLEALSMLPRASSPTLRASEALAPRASSSQSTGLRSEVGKVPSLASRAKGAFFGSVVADALALGTHYEYDAQKIRRFYGDIDRFYAPGEKTGGETHGIGWGARNFHDGNGVGPAKTAGECTDYGDYNILMLEHLAATADVPRRVDLEELVPHWMKALPHWRSWICTQTRQTYQQVQQGMPLSQVGGMSNAMALRSAAAYGYFSDEEDIAHAARTMMFTHREETALEGGEFFARVAFRVMHKELSPREAIKEVAATSSSFVRDKVQQALQKVDEAMDPEQPLSREEYADDLALTSMARLWDIGKSEPIKVGKASPTEGVLPGSIYFICKYDNLYEAARANAMVGGDSASRAVAVGMVLGAAKGIEAVPQHLRESLADWERLDALLDKLPLIRDCQQTCSGMSFFIWKMQAVQRFAGELEEASSSMHAQDSPDRLRGILGESEVRVAAVVSEFQSADGDMDGLRLELQSFQDKASEEREAQEKRQSRWRRAESEVEARMQHATEEEGSAEDLEGALQEELLELEQASGQYDEELLSLQLQVDEVRSQWAESDRREKAELEVVRGEGMQAAKEAEAQLTKLGAGLGKELRRHAEANVALEAELREAKLQLADFRSQEKALQESWQAERQRQAKEAAALAAELQRLAATDDG
ncbi:unnamed protein product [Polarella glacialis]|uniref:ADP-ribosylhydrolase ARH3 n=1 Tax=Polarella glacialis TaxID=89957 RepID=A0A813GML0_POLGL|nr:unnamed protein product [Polarella glacialis]